MNNFTSEVVRADDLLVLQFKFVNLQLDTGQPTPRLVRIQAGQPAFILIGFPPQHIAEQVFDESDAGVPRNLLDAPVTATMATGTSLAFRVPDPVASIPYTLHDLLAWTGYSPNLAPNALPDPPGASPLSATSGPAANPVNSEETSIDLPYRLQLSPDASAAWKHSEPPVTQSGRTELWHTRLGVRNSDGSVDESRLPALRAVWARDLPHFESAPPEEDESQSFLSADNRGQICRLSSDFSMPSGGGVGFYVPPALRAHRLVLSALGAWMDVSGSWIFPNPDPPRFTLTDWRHVVSMGRDQYVHVANAGFLLPFGHRVLLVQAGERKLETAPAAQRADYLMRRSVLAVQEPVKDYSNRALSYKRVRITTLTTPVLDTALSPTAPGFPVVGGAPFRFHLEVQDQDGRLVDFDLPLLWMPGVANFAYVAAIYNRDSVNRQADLRSQLVAFAPSNKPGDTHLKTSSMSFRVQATAQGASSPDAPLMDTAAVRLGAIDHLLGSSGSFGEATIRMHPTYLATGFAAGNAPEVFAQLVTALPLNVPASTAGGIATPGMALDGLTRALGPVPNVDNLVAGTPQDLQAIVSQLNGNLLGGVTLNDVISTATSPGKNIADQIPKIVTLQLPHAVDTSFDWRPEVKQINDGSIPIVTTPTTQLSIQARTHTSLDGTPPIFTADGSLTNFSINFIKIISLQLDRLSFHAEQNKKIDLGIRGVHISFLDALSFVNQLAAILPVDGLGAGPSIEVSTSGVTAGYTLALPATGVGVLSLENISLSAQLSVPFDNTPAGVRLAFSERHHPFLLSISFIGGGGFFAIGVNTHGVEQIEGCLEFGGNLTVGLGIVTANVHVLGGFYFGIKQAPDTGQAQLNFSAYLRIGGSVDLLGIVSVSIELYIGLDYDDSRKVIAGDGRSTPAVLRQEFYAQCP